MIYKQAYDLIIEAYFKDEIKPLHPEFCFCGTLCNSDKWYFNESGYGGYSYKEFIKMENALLRTMSQELGTPICLSKKCSKQYESALFTGMSAALDALKQIHIEKGEIIDEPIETFKKRELSQSNSMQPSTI